MDTTGIQVKKDFLGFQSDPQIDLMAKYSAEKYDKQYVPEAEKVVKAIQQPSPQSNIEAADAIQKMSGTDQPQWMNVLQSVINLNPREAAIFMNGGADVPTQAFDGSGKQWIKVFNERRSKQNPYGEERHYIDPETGKKYTRGELDKMGVGPVLSTQEIPVSQQNWYTAQGITAKQAAQAQIDRWNKTQTVAAEALINGPLIKDLSDQLEQSYNNPNFIKLSASPQVRELLAGVNEIRTGNSTAIRNSAETMKRFAKGDKKASEVNDSIKQTGGITFGLNYNEGKGWTNSEGKVVTVDDIEQAAKNAQSSLSSENQITSRKNDLLQKAQLAAAKGDLPSIDAIQNVINLEYQKSLAIQKIEDAGGIGIAKPSLAHEVGDSFSLAGVKNKMSANYGDLATLYGSQVKALKDSSPNKVPAIGDVEALIKSNPLVRESRAKTRASIEKYIADVEPVLKTITSTTPESVMRQPTAEMTSQGVVPKMQQPEVSGAPAGARPPKQEKSAPTSKQKVLKSIFGE